MQKILKKIFTLSAIAFSINALADAAPPKAGVYFGLQAGQGNTHYKAADLYPPSVNPSVSGAKDWAGRIYAGYQLYDSPFALELGYTYFTPVEAKSDGAVAASGKVIEQALDFVGKATYPLGGDFNLYGKLGAAFLMANSRLKLSCTNPATCNAINSGDDLQLYGDKTQQRLLPTASVGISYNITPSFPIDLSWTRIQKVGDSDLQSTDLIALGFAYNFGE